LGQVRLSKLAERDLLEIWFHIAADNGAETADYWIDRIEALKRVSASCPPSLNQDPLARISPPKRECW
jgi:plasmid stabilization system protein ParE